jgi:dCMP deaminase
MKSKFINFFMKVAEETATLSYATRLKVGAVIVKDRNIISFGYNGTPEGMDNSCESIDFIPDSTELVYNEMIAQGYTFGAYKDTAGWVKSQTKPEVIHAEANAITKLARQGGSGEGSTLFLTHAPCIECSKLIIQAGIKSVYFKTPYRFEDGINLLHKANIQTFKTE